MSKVHHESTSESTSEFPSEFETELSRFSIFPTLNKDQAVEFARNELDVNLYRNAIHSAINSGELPSSLVSGQALLAPRDLAKWILSKRRPNGPNRRSA